MATVDVRHGDCLEVLSTLPDQSIDAVITDPPYGLAFMGRTWDHQVPGPDYWQACLRVLKPGGHLLAFGGTRTAHRLAVAIEDAGFEIRDTITWLYGSGFPKSLDVSKAIDKSAGATREIVGQRAIHYADTPSGYTSVSAGGGVRPGGIFDGSHGERAAGRNITAPATEAARQWSGWGTALKPASEPIIVARKPLGGTVAACVLEHGTGALNIDATRVAGEKVRTTRNTALGVMNDDGWQPQSAVFESHPSGRWPANVVLTHTPDCDPECVDGCPVRELDAQSGTSASARSVRVKAGKSVGNEQTLRHFAINTDCVGGYDDQGGASRFFPTFRYQAKAPTSERPKVDGVAHPTVKPLALMRWLVRLVTPPGGTVLDPFAGSGTTGEAAALEGFDAVLIERDETYLPLIQARLERVA